MAVQPRRLRRPTRVREQPVDSLIDGPFAGGKATSSAKSTLRRANRQSASGARRRRARSRGRLRIARRAGSHADVIRERGLGGRDGQGGGQGGKACRGPRNKRPRNSTVLRWGRLSGSSEKVTPLRMDLATGVGCLPRRSPRTGRRTGSTQRGRSVAGEGPVPGPNGASESTRAGGNGPPTRPGRRERERVPSQSAGAHRGFLALAPGNVTGAFGPGDTARTRPAVSGRTVSANGAKQIG